jgi:hypothetical protein
MNEDLRTAQDDLAFMRGLVQGDEGGGGQAMLGEAFLAGGIIYGLQTLGHWAQGLGLLKLPGWGGIALGAGPSFVFLFLLAWIGWRARRSRPVGAAARGVGAAFSVTGLANICLILIIGRVALEQKSLLIWLIYPCVVFVLQGAAWLIAAQIRKRGWYAAVGVGWLAASVAMGFSLGHSWLPGIVVFALLVLMALPGYVLMRLARRPA